MKRKTIVRLALLALLCLVAAGGYWLWQQQKPTLSPVSLAGTDPAPPAASEPVPAPAPARAEPAIAHPLEPASGARPGLRPLPAADKADAYVGAALVDLLGRKAVLTFLSTDRFAARLVATVDNLDRPHAAARLWPVNPTPAKFGTVNAADGSVIGAENARRYTPFVQFIAAADTARAVALYKQLYPLFQKAYEELGYPGKYFNDRLVGVIDHLLETPLPAGPLKVKLTEVKGPIESATPWVRHEYADPALEARSSGQKILLRVGPENALRLKAKLAELRRGIARTDATR